MVPDWKQHCEYMMICDSPEQHREIVDLLLKINTCFFSETAELTIFMTCRGADALNGYPRTKVENNGWSSSPQGSR